jgi:lipoprotein signal peptidase
MADALFIYGLVSVIGIIFYFVFFTWVVDNFPTGKKQNYWSTIKSDVFSSWVVPVIAILCSFISLFYLVRYPNHMMFLTMGISCIAAGLSVASLSYALVSR